MSASSPAEYAALVVPSITTVRSRTRVANAGVPRPSTASTAARSSNITSTRLHCWKSSSIDLDGVAPLATSGAHFATVRFQTMRGTPAASRRPAIGRPIVPIPTNPTVNRATPA